jgi:DNA mismatch repair protein MutL
MSPFDLALCIERHATSKLSSLEDLDRIATLGFRGEALPSVSAVAEVSLISRTAESDSAYELIAGDVADRGLNPPAAKRVTFGHFNNSIHGTRIQARGLFSQVPARLKFLKSPAAEVSAVREWVERLALAYPQVGFQIYSGERKLLGLRSQTELERVQEILGEGEEYPIVFIENESDPFRDRGLKIRLYWLQGLSSPQNRRLVQVVNSRPLRDRFLQQALMSPFRQSLLPGQFPAIALLIEINPAAIDVNVHPTKSEVRFLEKNKIFSTLDTMVRGMIARKGAPGRVPLQLPIETEEHTPHSFPSFPSPAQDSAMQGGSSRWGGGSLFKPLTSKSLTSETGTAQVPHWSASEPNLNPAAFQDPEPFAEPEFVQTRLEIPVPSPYFSGPPLAVFFHTYLVYEDGNELVLIDQHAAHERIRYEKLKKRLKTSPPEQNPRSSQALLIPETVKLEEAELVRVQTQLPLLDRLGFEVETFGEDTLLFRSIPTEWGHRNLKVRLKNLTERLLEIEPQEENLWMDETLFESLASEACHSAVRAGDSLSLSEAQQITRDLFLCEHPWNCPHGRPTVVRVPMRKLEEWFQRKL